MVIDIGKGILAAAVIPGLTIPGVGVDPEIDRALVRYAVAFAAIAGHVFPVWFGFRGGKGGATAAGLIVYFVPALALPVIGAWILVVLLTGFVGLATISAALAAVASVGFTRLPSRAGCSCSCALARCCSSMRIAATSGACSTAPSRASRASA